MRQRWQRDGGRRTRRSGPVLFLVVVVVAVVFVPLLHNVKEESDKNNKKVTTKHRQYQSSKNQLLLEKFEDVDGHFLEKDYKTVQYQKEEISDDDSSSNNEDKNSDDDDDDNDEYIDEASANNSSSDRIREKIVEPFHVQAIDPEYQNVLVVERYKLIFVGVPKVGSTVWKMLFRRLLGYEDWNQQSNGLPHDSSKNGLIFTKHYTTEQATMFWTSDEWTRAIFVRPPMERFLSAYLDKGTSHLQATCCRRLVNETAAMACFEKSTKTTTTTTLSSSALLQSFVDLATTTCRDPHWKPQHERLSPKYWNKINFVGYMNHQFQSDMERLFRRLGLWNTPYIQTGWGRYGTERNASLRVPPPRDANMRGMPEIGSNSSHKQNNEVRC